MFKQRRTLALGFAVILGYQSAWPQSQAPGTPSPVDDFAVLLISTKDPQERDTLLAANRDLLTPSLRKALIREGSVHLVAGRYSAAFEIYGIARNVAERIGDKEGLATALLDIGTVHYFQANYPEALKHYTKARELFLEVGNSYESAKALSGVALIYKEQRRDAEALSALQKTLAEFTKLFDREEMANTLSSIGTIYYGQGNYSAAADAFLKSSELNTNTDNTIRIADSLYMQGDYTQASHYYKQSLATLLETNANATTIAALNGAANSAYYQGNYDEALNYFQQNLVAEEKLRDRTGFANTLRGIGNVHRSRGDFAAALESYFKSLAITEQLKGQTGTLLGSIGLVRALQGNNKLALEFYDKSRQQFEADGNWIDLARVLSLIGNAHYAQADYSMAIDSYRKGLTLRQAADDKAGQADLLVGLGSAFLRQENYEESLHNYESALALVETTANKSLIAATLTRVADVHLAQHNFTQALSIARRAAALARETESPDILWYAELLIGKSEKGLNNRFAARAAIENSAAIVDSLRDEPIIVAAEEGRNTLRPYADAVDLLLAENKPYQAFEFADRAKVQYLYELLRRNNARSTKGLYAEEQAEERKLVGESISLLLQSERIAQLPTATEMQRKALNNRLRDTRHRYATLHTRFLTAHPRLMLERGELPRVRLEELRTLIANRQTAILEYSITEENVYLFAFTLAEPNSQSRQRGLAPTVSLTIYPVNISSDGLRSLVNQLNEKLSSPNDDVTQPLRKLYDVLLKPAEAVLSKSKKLVIVPDGILWQIPFEALQSDSDSYLIDQGEVSYAPSIAALRELNKQRRTPAKNNSLKAFANPVLAKDLTDRIKLAYDELHLVTSNEQENEVNAIGRVYPAAQRQIVVGAQATEERVKLALASGGIVHLATPALFDDSSPMSSLVALAGTNETHDGFLQLREVLGLRAPAQLVLLTSAQTKRGQFGASMLCLSWSWFAAGTPRVILSRWRVNSPPVTQFMTTLHTKVKGGMEKTRALQQSALTLRNSTAYRHPYYWASFSLIGDGH